MLSVITVWLDTTTAGRDAPIWIVSRDQIDDDGPQTTETLELCVSRESAIATARRIAKAKRLDAIDDKGNLINKGEQT